MSAPQFTRGPWTRHIDKAGIVTVRIADRPLVDIWRDRDPPLEGPIKDVRGEQVANADLVAAAPDLYAAAEAALLVLIDSDINPVPGGAVERLERALAKARGEAIAA